MNNIDRQYQALLQDILDSGVRKGDRTGTGTISVFGRQIRHKMSEGFPLLTTKKVAFKTMVTELLWFLRGDTNIKYLVDNGCHIWDGDAYKNYLKKAYQEEYNKLSNNGMFEIDLDWQPITKEEFIERIKTDGEFAKKWGELGPIYGKQWRSWDTYNFVDDETHTNKIDQIADAIHKLKTNPDDRGIIVTAWNVADLDLMVLRPCHNFFQFYTRELSLDERAKLHSTPDIFYHVHGGCISIGDCIEDCIDDTKNFVCKILDEANIPKRTISLMWNQRSVDTPLGLPFNIASYALLLEIVGKMVNMVPDELIGNLGDTHIYLNQVGGINEQLTREPYELPSLRMGKTDDFFKSLSNDLSLITHLDVNDFVVENYKSHPAIKIPLSN